MLPTKTTIVGRWLVTMETLKFPKSNGMEEQSIMSENSRSEMKMYLRSGKQNSCSSTG